MSPRKFPRYLVPAAILAALLAMSASTILAKEDWQGRPEFAPGAANGYFVWKDGDGWHVRWTNKGEKKFRYEGTITTSGSFSRFEAVEKDRKDTIRKVSDDRIVFDAQTQGKVDGVNFRTSPDSASVTFDLREDGSRADVEKIRIGRNKERPHKVPFTLGETRIEVYTKPASKPKEQPKQRE